MILVETKLVTWNIKLDKYFKAQKKNRETPIIRENEEGGKKSNNGINNKNFPHKYLSLPSEKTP